MRLNKSGILSFSKGFERIIVIGRDMYDLKTHDLNKAFEVLKTKDFVIGPAEDGGYYFLGMTQFNASIFKNKAWGTESVLADTLSDLKDEDVQLFETRNDIDLFEDIKDIKAFHPYLKHI